MNSDINNKQGFTLIEVLVASLILFMTLSVFTMILRTSLISNEKALDTVELSIASTMILDKVSQNLQSKHALSNAVGEGILKGTKYSWSAKVKKTANPPKTYLGRLLVQPEHQIKIWEVTLKVQSGNRQSEYVYQESTW